MPSSSYLSLLLLPLLPLLTHAATFDIINKCPYTLWAAAMPGGGQQLAHNQTWTLTIDAGTVGRIWARTNCSFDRAGNGSCLTGDCHGLLACRANGTPPNTLAEFALNQFTTSQDFYDVSLIDGFNVPVDFGPTAAGCRRARCAVDLNASCPAELRLPGGCGSPCEVFQTDEYCCTSGVCSPNKYSSFFRSNCPDAYIGPSDGQTSTFVCPTGTNYTVVFCP